MDNKEYIKTEIDWLKKLTDGLETLSDKQFKYNEWVSAMVRVGTGTNDFCGTVCCAFGWMPKFVPESGVKWCANGDGVNLSVHNIFVAIGTTIFYVNNVPVRGSALMNFIFFGNKNIFGITETDFLGVICDSFEAGNSWESTFGRGDYDATLSEVINRIRAVVAFIENTTYKISV